MFKSDLNQSQSKKLKWWRESSWSSRVNILSDFLKTISRNPAVKLPPITPIHPIDPAWAINNDTPSWWLRNGEKFKIRMRKARCLIMAINLLSAPGRCQLWSKGHLAWEIKIYLLYFSISKYDLLPLSLCQTDLWTADWRCWWNRHRMTLLTLKTVKILTFATKSHRQIVKVLTERNSSWLIFYVSIHIHEATLNLTQTRDKVHYFAKQINGGEASNLLLDWLRIM